MKSYSPEEIAGDIQRAISKSQLEDAPKFGVPDSDGWFTLKNSSLLADERSDEGANRKSVIAGILEKHGFEINWKSNMLKARKHVNEAGRTHRVDPGDMERSATGRATNRQMGYAPDKVAPRGAPDDKARIFDKVNPKNGSRKNRSVLKKMADEQGKGFEAINYMHEEDYVAVLVMRVADLEQYPQDMSYYGVNVLFRKGGKVDGVFADKKSEKQWANHKAEIIRVAKNALKNDKTLGSAYDGLGGREDKNPGGDYHGYLDPKTNESMKKFYIKSNGSNIAGPFDSEDEAEKYLDKLLRKATAADEMDDAKIVTESKKPTFKEFLVITEGTWAIPTTVDQAEALKKLLSSAIKPADARKKLYNMFGDDSLFDGLDGDEDDNIPDARPTIKHHLRKMMKNLKPEVQKVLRDISEE